MQTPEEIRQAFPFDEFRPGQEECISQILSAFDSGKRFVVLEAPTGSGKSVIGMTIANLMDNAYYLTVQKILQDQLASDFESKETVCLKGRNAYPCDYWTKYAKKHRDSPSLPTIIEKARKDPVLSRTFGKAANCGAGYCLAKDGKGKCSLCFPGGMDNMSSSTCPYWKTLYKAIQSKTCIMNFHSFLYQTQVSGRFDKRELMIVDESHQAEPQLMDFISLGLSDKRFRKQGITFAKLDTAEQYSEFFIDNQLQDKITDIIRLANYTRNFKEADEWKKILLQYQIFTGSVSSGEWIPKYEEKRGYNKITLKPIFVDKHANRYLFSHSDKILMMSATILSPKIIYESLGIDPSEAYAYRMKNRFPLKNRPIYFTPVGSMSYKNKLKTKPKLLKSIIEICNNYPTSKGIIHTHNFEISNYVMDNSPKNLQERLLFQNNFNSKDDLLKEHSIRTNSIIIAPAMHEGLDLKGSLSRFQIICKVPFPSLGDNDQLKVRMQVSDTYFDWLSALKLVQSVGRSVRSETDYADTFILDQDFEFFRKKASKLLPDWFKQAIV